MNVFKLWLLNKYAPSFLFKTPSYDDTAQYHVAVVIEHGYWGCKRTVVYSDKVVGIKKAYLRARWLALKAAFIYPAWLYDYGVLYTIKADIKESI